ncbi:uncharacterized protein LOC112155896 [Oryzias melastigma]|uniref:uncharacterized protein LOC112155896 n=1 Tax=Oryzias melastigma TaxID=30732 RepID=UPI000CF7B50F|nr:uncharacterized protein LOC112155896 [Oryzias melastigma]
MTSESGQLPSRTGAVVLPTSSRTVQHPSFMPLSARHHGGAALYPILPEEVFFIDPSMHCRERIPNLLTRMRAFDFSRLNTPQPIMSSCPAPPNHPDPFRSGPHPTRDLGSLTWTGCGPDTHLQPPRAIIQLSQEEDQAVTNLLKLHHQEATGSNYTQQTGDFTNVFNSAAPMSPTALLNHQRSKVRRSKELTDLEGNAVHVLLSLGDLQ